MKPLLIIGGATGSGKSDIAVACAKILNGEILSMDSMQIYRELNIGTAKITQEEMRGVPHHLIDICSPEDSFTAADYKVKAQEIIKEVQSRGKLPILCGGTGLYLNAVLYDLSFSGEFDPKLRNELLAEAKEKGKEAMHEKLRALDPDAANRLHPNDEKRVIRAIEKAMTGGEKERDFEQAKYPYRLFVTDLPREVLYQKIERRVDRMMREGLLAEVKDLLRRGIGYDKQCMQAIAYKEWAFADEGMKQEDVVALIKKNTRNYAKRQITWFKQYQDAVRISVEDRNSEEIAEEIARIYEGNDEDTGRS